MQPTTYRQIFSGASQNENVGDFPLRSDGWKDLMREKQVFMGASQNENISGGAFFNLFPVLPLFYCRLVPQKFNRGQIYQMTSILLLF
ncbi:MAG: hypothetical protein QNJ74_23990 [Trichodesmium sp. MO_231.B1]|nr:hypothetical protein [Trichodesmium sp. MO_231.B1]